jgi:hypothetical protein
MASSAGRGEPDDDRPEEVTMRVPNGIEDDVAEVESLEEMWLHPQSVGGALLQFYPDSELVSRQLSGNTYYQQTAVVFHPERVLDLHARGGDERTDPNEPEPSDTIPTRLSTPLSVAEACYPRGGIVGVYRGGDPIVASRPRPGGARRFLVPHSLLVISLERSPPYVRRLAEVGRRSEETLRVEELTVTVVASSQRAVIDDLCSGLQPPRESYSALTLGGARSLVNVVRSLSLDYFLFLPIELGEDTRLAEAISLFSELSWSLDDYGLYERTG